MRTALLFPVAAVLATLLACGDDEKNETPSEPTPAEPSPPPSEGATEATPVTVSVKDGTGKDVGTVTISPAGSGVSLQLALTGLPPGSHAIHFHEKPSCEGPDFKSAAGHFNPEKKHHGTENPEGPHAGDMPNVEVGADGTASATIENPRVSLDPNATNSLVANGGTALVIHAKEDDMKSDPAGNAGERIACGVVQAGAATPSATPEGEAAPADGTTPPAEPADGTTPPAEQP